MSVTVDDLIRLLDTQENKYGGATGKPRELNVSINGNFCGCIESAKLDGYGDGLVTDVSLEIAVPKMKEYYDKEIRNKVIDTFMIAIETLVKLHGAVTLSEIQDVAEQLKNGRVADER